MKFTEHISSFTRYVIILLVVLAVTGCNELRTQHTTVTVTITNSSTNTLDWVDVEWKGPYMAQGILSPGISKGILDLEWPFLPDAKITFIDEITRNHYSIPISFESANERIKSGKCREVIIRILSYEKAEVVCE